MMTLHHARHSFYNVLTPVLFGLKTPLTQTLTEHLDSAHIRTIILGHDHLPSRRSAMALARLMGHTTPNTGFKSYNRLIAEWADALTPVHNTRVRKIPNAIQVQHWSVQIQPAKDSPPPLFPTQLPTPRNIAQALRLKSLGYRYDRTEAALQLCPGSLKSLDRLVEKVNRRNRFKVFDFEQQKWVQIYGEKLPNRILEIITPEAWVRLIEKTESFPLPDALDQVINLPSTKHIPALVGRNGHLLMSTPEHFELIRLVLKLFQVPEGNYDIYARYNNPRVTERMTEYGFNVGTITKTDTGEIPQLDTFSIDLEDSRKLEQQYGAVIFRKGFARCIHNGHELVIAMLIVAASYCSQ